MNGTNQLLDRIEITLHNDNTGHELPVYIDIADNSLSRKWLRALNHLITEQYHLEKNYCWFGWPDGARNGELIISEINRSIQAINTADLGYSIDDSYHVDNCIDPNLDIYHDHFNQLHRYFEDLQGTSGALSPYYAEADAATRWHIRQLNLLCHEFESWALSWKKKHTAPEWVRPSQLMCWLRAPRYELTAEDYELFGIETLNRPLGAVYVGVNKAVGKHHWEVFRDEGRDSRISELTTTTLRGQTEAAGDFDIEWANNPGTFPWMQQNLRDFRTWLQVNGFDPDDKSLTIGHPQVGQVDLLHTFGTRDYGAIWHQLSQHQNVVAIKTTSAYAEYKYTWSDSDYIEQQILALQG